MGKRALSKDRYPLIARAYKAGATTVALAAEHGVSEGTIRTVLCAAGCAVRARTDRARRAHRAAGRGRSAALSQFERDGWLYIDPEPWAELRARYTDEQLADELHRALLPLPLPYPELTERKALRAFNALRKAPLNSLFGAGPIELLRCPPTAQAGYHLALKPPGNAASNELFCRQRWATARASEPSVVQRWQDQDLRLKVCRRFLKLSGTDRMSPSAFRRALCVTGATPSQFKPGAARALYELVGAADVLDLSAGWGDRLVGFCAAAGTRRYLGIDPNEALHPLYRQAAQRYAGDKTVDLLCGPAEDAEIPADSFDMALTSPPYFQVEKYAEGTDCAKNQSWARYPTMQQWRAGFLAPVMRAAWNGLRQGGVLAINLADVQTADGAAPLCRWLQEEVGALPGATPMPTIGMRLQSSNYTAEQRCTLSGEPVWTWSKGPLAKPLCIVASEGPIEAETEGLADDAAEQ